MGGIVPGGCNKFFSLGTGIGIEEMSEEHQPYFCRNITVILLLSSCGCGGEDEENKPWETDFEEHLEVKYSEHTWVELSPHEEIIEETAGHAMFSAAVDGGNIGTN